MLTVHEADSANAARSRFAMPRLTVRHLTSYHYRHPVGFGDHRMMLRPRDTYDQRLIESRLVITPEPVEVRWLQDVFGNAIAVARFAGRALELQFDSVLVVDQSAEPPLQLDDHAREYPFSYDAEDMPDLARYIERQMPDPGHLVDRWARTFAGRNAIPTLEMLEAMTLAIRHRFTYKSRHEPGVQEPRTTLRLETGTCRDFALLMMEAVRSLGLAAKYVTGYLYTRPGRAEHDYARQDSASRGGGNTHAWLQVFLPGAGWVEFDPTNGTVGSAGLVRVAAVRTPAQAVPLAGSWIGAPSDCLGMEVSVDVTQSVVAEPSASLARLDKRER